MWRLVRWFVERGDGGRCPESELGWSEGISLTSPIASFPCLGKMQNVQPMYGHSPHSAA